MTREPMIDHGQTLTGPAGKVIGFLDGKEKFESFADTLLATGYPETSVTLLYGEDGIHILERMQEHRFFFSDSEDSIIQTGIRELKLGHCAVSVEVADRQHAVDIAKLAKPHGGHGFIYFGTWVNERIPT
ncbi:hypothetical protein [Gimesia maris]|uniref:Uncharacterized protein n=1 Tax=Gimesia maris TaxID=122 RepID=A0ABX5YK73_9PLAN|nr:hypothetical protein [Gimesia maris]EDL56788.1 hypothetical protein PM8797T_02649 [Gimesia maris DSM 8797]QEG16040.1 hypothetical protein GmarT_19010 [Gimesia maris]QGQ30709.1 hypothetical protein F1729_19810 [Gimesia maris]